MKVTILKSPKLYIWIVLILLPVKATLFTYIRAIDLHKGIALFQRRPIDFEAAILTGDTLSGILYALIAFSVALLLVALSLSKPNGTQIIRGIPGGPTNHAGRGLAASGK